METPHTLARFGPIRPDLLLATSRVDSFGATLALPSPKRERGPAGGRDASFPPSRERRGLFRSGQERRNF